MRKVVKILLVVVFCLFYTTTSFSQESEEILQRRLTEKIMVLNDYMSFMANPQKDYNTRHFFKKQALCLFLGNGYEYEIDGVKQNGAMIEIDSPMRRKPSRKLLRSYFEGLTQLLYDYSIAIEAVTYVSPEFSSLKAINDSTYICTCELRKFPESDNTNNSVCTIRNWKWVKVIIKKKDIDSIEGGDIIMPILLCDIYAIKRNNK